MGTAFKETPANNGRISTHSCKLRRGVVEYDAVIRNDTVALRNRDVAFDKFIKDLDVLSNITFPPNETVIGRWDWESLAWPAMMTRSHVAESMFYQVLGDRLIYIGNARCDAPDFELESAKLDNGRERHLLYSEGEANLVYRDPMPVSRHASITPNLHQFLIKLGCVQLNKISTTLFNHNYMLL